MLREIFELISYEKQKGNVETKLSFLSTLEPGILFGPVLKHLHGMYDI